MLIPSLNLKRKIWMRMSLYQNPSLSLEDQLVVEHLVQECLVEVHLVQEHLVHCRDRDRDTVLDHLVEEVVEEDRLVEDSRMKKLKSSAGSSRNVRQGSVCADHLGAAPAQKVNVFARSQKTVRHRPSVMLGRKPWKRTAQLCVFLRKLPHRVRQDQAVSR